MSIMCQESELFVLAGECRLRHMGDDSDV